MVMDDSAQRQKLSERKRRVTPEGLVIGGRVRRVMNDLGLSQVELAEQSGTGANFVNRLILGFFREPSSVKMAKLARVLGTTVEELVTGEPPHSDLVRAPETHVGLFHRLARIPAHYVDEATELAWLHWSRERRLTQEQGREEKSEQDAGEEQQRHLGRDQSGT